MTKGRDIAAESISDLLDVARAQRRNGLLRAERSQGGRLEEGEIYLVAGQPIYARTGGLVGLSALNHLLSWRNIYFSFVTDVPQPPANIFSTLRPYGTTTTLGPRTQSLGSFSFPATRGLKWDATESRETIRPASLPPRGNTPGIERLVPWKREPEREIFTLNLSRRQRLIYFLVDGQRKVADLARTTNKTVLETELVINELQELGLISL